MNEKRKRGKTPQVIEWPDGVFTADMVHQNVASALSRVSVHTKINNAVDSGTLERVGTVKLQLGRPKVQYQKTQTPQMHE